MSTSASSSQKGKLSLAKLIQRYYDALKDLAHQNVMYEMGNREDDPQYIVRLVGQVVRVSVETVKIVRSLPVEFSDQPSNGTET